MFVKLMGVSTLALFASTSHAFQIYPSQNILGINDSCQQQQAESALDCLFTEAVSSEEYKQELRDSFKKLSKQVFPSYIVDNIVSKTRNQTWVLSAEVVRASRYNVNKGTTSEVFLPITVSLKLTNIMTGEVLFSRNYTEIQPASFLTADIDSESTKLALKTHYQTLLKSSLEGVLKEAGQVFQPSRISSQAQKVWKGYVILDKGLESGIGNNDELVDTTGSSSIRVIHSEPQYAVAVPILGNDIRKDTIFEKMATSTKNAVRKPKALLADISVPKSVSPSLVEQLFSDNLGEATFSLLPINARFTQLSQSISQETDLSQEHIAALDVAKSSNSNFRPLPDLFLRVSVAEPLTYSLPSATGGIEHRVFESRVYGDLLDNTGRVIFAAQAKDRIEEKTPKGSGFDTNARIEVVTKNALLELAKKFTTQVKFSRFSLKVDDVNGDTFDIVDKEGQLQVGAAIKVFRKINVDGMETLIPLWEARIEQRSADKAIARLLLPITSSPEQTLKPKSNDIVLLDSATQGGSSGIAFCKDNPNAIDELNFGNIPQQAYYFVASKSKVPVYGSMVSYTGQISLADAVQKITQNTGFRTAVKPQFFYPTDQACLFTHYKIQMTSKDNCHAFQENDSVCQVKTMAGIAIKKKGLQGDFVESAGLSQNTTIKEVLSSQETEIIRDNAQLSIEHLLKQIYR
jgi:hypothetical protein